MSLELQAWKPNWARREEGAIILTCTKSFVTIILFFELLIVKNEK
jgi:hypothetical protein